MTRLIAVGDTHQAIYAFRGADAAAMGNLIDRTQATLLPLSICYRCAKAIVREAQAYVPTIEECETQVEGSVTRITKDELFSKVGERDFVLCRTTAPLIKVCLEFIRKGKRASVKGRDLGKGLIEVIDQIGGNTVEAFLENLENWAGRQREFVSRTRNELLGIELEDKVECLKALCFDCSTINSVKDKIANLFSDGDVGILFCTVHRSKGLETNNVFILRPDLLPHPKATQDWAKVQENNLTYVAITRAQENLVWVDGE